MEFGGKLDAHIARQDWATLDAMEESDARAERIMDRQAAILGCDGEIYEAVDNDYDTDAGRAFWESVRDMMEHGGEADDVQFLEAARGMHDAVMKLAEQQAEREEGVI